MEDTLKLIVGFFVFLLFLLLMYFYVVPFTKGLSYEWWYEDHVRATVHEVLIEEGLIK